MPPYPRELNLSQLIPNFEPDAILPRLRRLFWLEATKAEKDFNHLLVKPMLKQHDRNLHLTELRAAMEVAVSTPRSSSRGIGRYAPSGPEEQLGRDRIRRGTA